ncbi:MAG: radical SAM protein [Sandaracinaceae bacterium]
MVEFPTARLQMSLARAWVSAYDAVTDRVSRRLCYGLYDGRRLASRFDAEGPVPVLLVIPPMSDVNGALPHPGVRVLQSVLRDRGVACEVLNYNLPCREPRDPFEHLIRAIRVLGVRVLGVSTYSQAIRPTLEGLRRVARACPDVTVVLGGPHPTEAYQSLLGVSFVDYVCRGEAEESFPALVDQLLQGRTPLPGSIPGVYRYDRDADRVEGTAARFIDLERADRRGWLRYHFSEDELRQQRLYRGAHGTSGPAYWPVQLVRGCPYDCTFCAAWQMSGKRLRYRDPSVVVDDLEFYATTYGATRFSFIDDAFTQDYGFVVTLCREILDRNLEVEWTTDNGIRYETLAQGRPLSRYLAKGDVGSVEGLVSLMIRAGWRGTAIGIESGSARVRRELVRKGGARLDNEAIVEALVRLKRLTREAGVYFYVNAFLMAGFPRLPLKNGRVVAAETADEMEETARFARQLRECGAVDMMNLSMVIPLPGTDTWDCLTIAEKLTILLSRVPAGHLHETAIRAVANHVIATYSDDLGATRYDEDPEALFWRRLYHLPEDAQILVMQSFDAFNADAAHELDLDRPDAQTLWDYREAVVSEFYAGLDVKTRMLRHVWARSGNLRDAAAYLTLMGRKLAPAVKTR